MALNTQNLIVPTSERAREIGAMGGKAAQRNAKARKSMVETWEVIRRLPLKDGDAAEISEIQSVSDASGANLTVEQAIILAMTKKALKGDVKAFEALSKYTANNKNAELNNEKLRLEIERMKIDLQAYKDATTQMHNMGVVILDDIPTDTDTDASN